jgi:hypothetical protein
MYPHFLHVLIELHHKCRPSTSLELIFEVLTFEKLLEVRIHMSNTIYVQILGKIQP